MGILIRKKDILNHFNCAESTYYEKMRKEGHNRKRVLLGFIEKGFANEKGLLGEKIGDLYENIFSTNGTIALGDVKETMKWLQKTYGVKKGKMWNIGIIAQYVKSNNHTEKLILMNNGEFKDGDRFPLRDPEIQRDILEAMQLSLAPAYTSDLWSLKGKKSWLRKGAVNIRQTILNCENLFSPEVIKVALTKIEKMIQAKQVKDLGADIFNTCRDLAGKVKENVAEKVEKVAEKVEDVLIPEVLNAVESLTDKMSVSWNRSTPEDEEKRRVAMRNAFRESGHGNLLKE